MKYVALFTDENDEKMVIIEWEKSPRFNKRHLDTIILNGIGQIIYGCKRLDCVITGTSDNGIIQSTMVIKFKIEYIDNSHFANIYINDNFYRTIEF